MAKELMMAYFADKDVISPKVHPYTLTPTSANPPAQARRRNGLRELDAPPQAHKRRRLVIES